MGTKEQLLALFEEGKGIFFSGEELAEKLKVSRTSIWKAVGSLRKEGYELLAVQNKGYCLLDSNDILSAQGIRKYLQEDSKLLDMTVLPATESTNLVVREKALAGAKEGYLVIANRQTNGKGRVGRSFYSPADTGIYLSLLLRPGKYTSPQATMLTTMAAVAACEAIEKVSQEKASIKWVNDIFVQKKKVCGILTEASLGMEDGFLEYAILGVGFNAYTPKEGFPEEIKETAGAIFSSPQRDGKNHLAAEFLNCFMKYYHRAEEKEYVCKYRERSFVVGKKVSVLFVTGTKEAVVLDVDEECHLLVRYEDGTKECLSSGEVSLRIAHSPDYYSFKQGTSLTHGHKMESSDENTLNES